MNAKSELADLLKMRNLSIRCAEVIYDPTHNVYEYSPKNLRTYDKEDNGVIVIRLLDQYGGDEYLAFLKALDFEYDNGFGGQELYGTIWFTDGTWAERGEYDGSEWWEHHKKPNIPIYLQPLN